MDTRPRQAGPTDPVTVVVRRRVDPARVDAFERWLEGIIKVATAFQGHLGTNVLAPADPSAQDYVVIFRFDTAANLAKWEGSPERDHWLEKVEPLTVGSAKIDRVSGLEFWFTAPASDGCKPPAKHRMAAVTVLGLYPLIMFVAPPLSAVLADLPAAIRTLVVTVIMVMLMTWAVMPTLVGVLSFWLFPSSGSRTRE
ncbi:MAG: antibiotic biosynthesis monooxygenase [Nannocystaceae bacterium]|nr:antibiotic biosynthesis monooxygenase [Nannocystaceae bacterium]